jgi:putative PIN family toxin of toxin-antitoxin system
VELVSSTPLLAELQGVLNRPKFAQQLAQRGITVSDVFDGYAAIVQLVVPAPIVPTIVHDPADDQVLATAHACHAHLIVSGDSHLLDLKQFMGIDIVTAASAIRRVGL